MLESLLTLLQSPEVVNILSAEASYCGVYVRHMQERQAVIVAANRCGCHEEDVRVTLSYLMPSLLQHVMDERLFARDDPEECWMFILNMLYEQVDMQSVDLAKSPFFDYLDFLFKRPLFQNLSAVYRAELCYMLHSIECNRPDSDKKLPLIIDNILKSFRPFFKEGQCLYGQYFLSSLQKMLRNSIQEGATVDINDIFTFFNSNSKILSTLSMKAGKHAQLYLQRADSIYIIYFNTMIRHQGIPNNMAEVIKGAGALFGKINPKCIERAVRRSNAKNK